MNYLAFSRKYRPQNFDDVVGQQHITMTLKNAIINNRVHHAYLFCGSRGVGKTSTARIFAKALNCDESEKGLSCNKCLICQRISSGEDIDVLEIDGASNRGIEEIRNIKNDIKYLPSQAKYKIFIIDEVHMLTQAAFNALLKTLEEPPQHVKFIFATTQAFSIPDTILSRCQRFDFRKINMNDVVMRLEQVASLEKIEISQEALLQIAQMAKGALRDSLVLLDQVHSYSNGKIELSHLQQIIGDTDQYILDTLIALSEKNTTKLLEIVAKFNELGGDFSNYIDQLAQHLRDLLVLIMSGEKCINGTDYYLKQLASLKEHFSKDYLMQAIHHTITCKMHFQRGLLGRILLETLLLKIANIETLLPIEEMIKKLSQMEKKNFNANTTTINPQEKMPPSNILTKPENEPPEYIENRQPEYTENNNPIQENRFASRKKAPEKKTALDFFHQPEKTKQKDNNPQTLCPTTTYNVVKEVQEDVPGDPWEHFIVLLSKDLGRMAKILKDEAKVSLKEQHLSIKLDACHKITGDVLKNKKNHPILVNAIKKAYGQTVNVSIDYGELPRKNQEKQKSIVENDPLVSLCLELFGGRVTKVEEMEK